MPRLLTGHTRVLEGFEQDCSVGKPLSQHRPPPIAQLYDIGQPGWFYRFMNPRDPAKARRRVGHLYWKCLKRLVLSSYLLFFGIVFLLIGSVCHFTCDDSDRAWAFQFCGLLIFLPGIYGVTILTKYVMGHNEYTWKLLPEPS
eukprot:TRINITY_DN4494_c0_g1_i2.p2 TRINITY_DN4494_c0_g1~~TRINITY_DN4494_c0_g1_i2.p2  ORF type:complete len:143 (+),score=32.83 TRINITY_DN4494_c0_g1_i2:610-1038(+)